MYDLLYNRFSFEAVKFNGQILACSVIIWAVVVGCALTSVWSQGWSQKRRIFWSVLVVAVPLLGVLAYIPFGWKGKGSMNFTFPKWTK